MDRRRPLKTILPIVILLIVCAVFLTRKQQVSPTATQPEVTTHFIESIQAKVELPPIDNLAALARAKTKEDKGIYRFAEAIPVQITPLTHGTWETLSSGGSRWTLEVESPGASSLNFGFSRYEMPEGGTLTIQKPHGDPAFRRFTSADNESHGELWTPLLHGDSAVISVDLADNDRNSVVLELASVNHGFRTEKIGNDFSGSCNVDVRCDSLPEIGPLIEMFSDQIRSVGAYTLNGIDTCTGALINNTANDRRPFFLTANHCGVDAGNAASMVVFWNFENSSCRTPGMGASGGFGDGDTTQFNTGAIFRAGNSATDFTLVELDDPIASEVDPFYAGWDRTGANPESVIGIHHPAVAEKRISFSFTPTQTTSAFTTPSPGDGRFVRVLSWSNGTTEGGSSGSPLFDPSGLIIGQLFGGDAACGNTESDWYGRISQSWSFGNTPATRLSDWLDPIASGVTTLNGINQEIVTGDTPTIPPIANSRIPAGLPYVQRIDFAPANANLTASGLPAWLSLNERGFLTGTPPAGSSDTPIITLTASQAGILITTSYNIIIAPTSNVANDVGSGNAVTFLEESNDGWRSNFGPNSADSGDTFLRSASVSDSESSSLRAIVNGPATLTFAWSVDSEQNFDFLDFLLDGNLEASISGEVDWTNVTMPIPEGTHELEWIYIKDDSVSKGRDLGLLDTVALSGYGAWITVHSVNGFTDPTYDPDGDRRVNFMEYALGTDPSNPDSADGLSYDFESVPPVINVTKPSGVEGVRYLLQTSTDLTPGSWIESGSRVITDDESSFIASPSGTASKIFFRLGAEAVDP